MLNLKGNLHDDVDLFFKDCLASDFEEIPYDSCETVDGDHGRIETRRYWGKHKKKEAQGRMGQ